MRLIMLRQESWTSVFIHPSLLGRGRCLLCLLSCCLLQQTVQGCCFIQHTLHCGYVGNRPGGGATLTPSGGHRGHWLVQCRAEESKAKQPADQTSG